MKKLALLSLGISIVVFCVITYYTGRFEAACDGWNIVGWPIVFYKECGGCHNIITQEASDGKEFRASYLIIDFIIIYSGLLYLGYFLRKKVDSK
jgi:hypothetical protein